MSPQTTLDPISLKKTPSLFANRYPPPCKYPVQTPLNLISTPSAVVNLADRTKSWLLLSFRMKRHPRNVSASFHVRNATDARRGATTLTFNFVNPIVPWPAMVATLKASRWEYTLAVLGHFSRGFHGVALGRPWSGGRKNTFVPQHLALVIG